ncbi:MAG: biotin/lipoyl-binding protein, partial [Syntrophomonadaceae bacterium]|nr:biotin/lipoyl-binding protein [Syntrophomonadaceae bacterium]
MRGLNIIMNNGEQTASPNKIKALWQRRKKRIIVIGVLVLILLLLVLKVRSCTQNIGGEMIDPSAGMMPSTVMVDRGDVQRVIYATGSVMENNTEEITAEVSDKVTAIHVYEGQEVTVGDSLYTIDDSEAGLVIRKDRLVWQKKQKDLTEQIAALKSNEIYSEVGGV